MAKANRTNAWAEYDKTRPRSSPLQVRLTKEEHQHVREAAAKAGMPANEFFLYVIAQQEKHDAA